MRRLIEPAEVASLVLYLCCDAAASVNGADWTIDVRYGRTATLITSQYPPETWHEAIGDPTVADAILDRLIHGAYRIDLEGGSMREAGSQPRPRKSSRADRQTGLHKMAQGDK